MAEEGSRRRLGRGLAALIGEIDTTEPPVAAPRPDGFVPIELVQPNPRNPRRSFSESDLTDLSQSIREHGIVQPLVVRSIKQSNPEQYEIIAGERRLRAAQRLGLSNVPVLIRDVDDRVALEIAIIENVQRADLNPLEEASGYQLLIDDHQYTQADLGQVIGKSRSHVANTLRLLKLPESIRAMVSDGSLSAGHARALITLENPEDLAKRISAEGLSVRQAELLAQEQEGLRTSRKSSAKGEKDPDTVALETLLSDALGLRVAIAHRDRGGEVRIGYRTLEQLDDLCRRLKG